LSPESQHWIACRPGFFLSVRVLSRLFRRLFLERLTAAYQPGRLEFFADQAALAEPAAFQARLAALRKLEWVVYAKRPFGGPDAVLAYLFLPRGFSDACLRASLTPVTGRRPKTLNESGNPVFRRPLDSGSSLRCGRNDDYYL
jgi:putative transposase